MIDPPRSQGSRRSQPDSGPHRGSGLIARPRPVQHCRGLAVIGDPGVEAAHPLQVLPRRERGPPALRCGSRRDAARLVSRPRRQGRSRGTKGDGSGHGPGLSAGLGKASNLPPGGLGRPIPASGAHRRASLGCRQVCSRGWALQPRQAPDEHRFARCGSLPSGSGPSGCHLSPDPHRTCPGRI